MSLPKVGNTAPNINLPAVNDKMISLKEFRGKKNVVLYFYPKDDTPGCNIEAQGFRDNNNAIEKENAVVLGVSGDSLKKHDRFIEKFKLPFILLSDEERKTCQDYGVLVQKSMFGKKYMGIARTTFIIDREGKIAHVFEKVKPKDHPAEVLSILQSNQ